MTRFLFSIVIIMLIFVSPAAAAASELNFLVYANSKHFSEDIKHNERNNTIGLSYINGKHGVAVARYKDSFYTHAKYLSGIYLLTNPQKFDSFDYNFSLVYGAVKSPSYKDGDWIYFLLPSASVTYSNFGLNFIFLPKFKTGSNVTLGVQYMIRLEL